jgi:hypothetical protein
VGATTLAHKLRMKPGQQVLILNAPPGYIQGLGHLPEGIEPADAPRGQYDLVHLFVASRAELERLGPVALQSVKYDGLLWISYPKQSAKAKTDLNRDVGWDLVTGAGLRPVTQVAIDETWSALRFRPVERVGRSK